MDVRVHTSLKGLCARICVVNLENGLEGDLNINQVRDMQVLEVQI